MKKADHLTYNEWKQFERAFDKDVRETDHAEIPVRNRALIEMLFTLTLRVSDLLALKVKDVEDKNGNIRDKVYVTERKNDNFKGVKIRNKPKKALRDWLDIANLKRNDYVFPSPYTDSHISRQQVNNIIKEKLSEVEFEFDDDKVISTHSGRKTIARKMYEDGFREQTIRKALGHGSFETTKKYIGVNQRDVNEALEKVKM